MDKRVYNKTFGKIIRTLGFIFVLFASTFLSAKMILSYQDLPLINFLTGYAEVMDNAVTPYPFIDEYAVLILILGLIMLLWVIRKGIVLRVLLTVVLLFVYIEGTISMTSPLVPIALNAPSWIASILDLVSPVIDMLTNISPYIVPGGAVAVPFLLWVLFSSKKPKRFSLVILSAGSTLLFLAVATYAAKQFVSSLNDVEIFSTINVALYLLSYLAYMVGSAFGVLGFSLK